MCGGFLSSIFALESVGCFYAELDGGLSLHDKIDNHAAKSGFLAYGEFGYIYQNFRFALGLDYDQFRTKNFGDANRFFFKIKALFSTFNVYYDYALTDAANLYVGAGFCYGRMEGKQKENGIVTAKGHQTRYFTNLWQVFPLTSMKTGPLKQATDSLIQEYKDTLIHI